MKKTEIYSLINQKCNLRLNISAPYEIPTSTDEARTFLGENREIIYHLKTTSSYLTSYYQKVLGWLPANPSKPEIVDAIKDVYVFSSLKKNTANNILNTIEGHANFVTYITTDNDSNTIFVRGPKGSGKTFYLNYFLNTESDKLYDSGYIWYRADLSKLYRHNISIQNKKDSGGVVTEREYSLIEYFCVHIVYVSFKYQKKNAVFKKFWDDIDGSTSNLITEKWLANPKFQKITAEPDNLIDSFHEFVERIGIENEINDDENLEKETVQQLLWSDEEILTSELIAELLIAHLKKEGFSPLFIVDGLDNINFYKHEKYYNYLIDQVRQLCLKDDKSNKWNARYLISLRNETFQDMKSSTIKYFKSENVPIFIIKNDNPIEILRKKIEIALTPQTAYYNKKQKNSHDMVKDYVDRVNEIKSKNSDKHITYAENIKSTDNYYKEFGDNFLDKILESVNSIIPNRKRKYINEHFLLKNFYNGNIRAFLCNFLNIFNYHLLFVEKSLSISKNKLYVITEGQLLNGGLYLDTQHHIYEFGKCLPNIFWFDKSIECNIWHGLTIYRILQLLCSKSTPEKIAIDMLVEHFEYNEQIIRSSLSFCVSHGMITFNFNELTEDRDISITEKGRLLLEYYFYDINSFYILAIDTPISSQIIHECSTNILRYHLNDDETFWKNYIEACVITSITFIRHIMTHHNNELGQLSGKGKDLKEIFSMPKSFPGALIEEMSHLVNRLKGFKSNRFEELHHDIKGIV